MESISFEMESLNNPRVLKWNWISTVPPNMKRGYKLAKT